jgi:predicted  nucleic acid-binding Zn-ribbon protein
VRDQLSLIATLQQIDNRLNALQVDVEALPQQLKPYDAACVEARQALASVEEDIERTERQWRSLERELDRLQAQLVKTQVKLHGVKTNKEYSAVLAEIDTGKQHSAALEDEILELMEAVELQRQQRRQQERHVQASEQELAQQAERVRQEQAKLAEQVAVEAEGRQHIVADLESDLYARYQQLSAAIRDRQAVVLMQEGACGGCHLTVQPQLVSELRRQDTLITCPHCHRILLWPA